MWNASHLLLFYDVIQAFVLITNFTKIDQANINADQFYIPIRIKIIQEYGRDV